MFVLLPLKRSICFSTKFGTHNKDTGTRITDTETHNTDTATHNKDTGTHNTDTGSRRITPPPPWSWRSLRIPGGGTLCWSRTYPSSPPSLTSSSLAPLQNPGTNNLLFILEIVPLLLSVNKENEQRMNFLTSLTRRLSSRKASLHKVFVLFCL